MNILIITANPSSKGFTHKIVKKIIQISTEKSYIIEILDLYNTELKQDFLKYEHKEEIGKDDVTKKIQAKITWANELIFVFPIWWGDMPAIMKNFFDCNFVTGFGYEYVKGKAVGLLQGKSVRIITTSGAPSFFYKILLHIQFLWNINRINFCGMQQKSFTVFGNMDRKKTDKDLYLKKIEKLI